MSRVPLYHRVPVLSVGGWCVLGVQPDGQVLAQGGDNLGQNITRASTWTDCIAVCIDENNPDYDYGTAWALRSDGMIEGVFLDDEVNALAHPPDITDPVKMIAAGRSHIIGLRLDGTVVGDICRDQQCWNSYAGSIATQDWSNIVSIAAASHISLGLQADGTIVGCGPYSSSKELTDIPNDGSFYTAIAMSETHALALRFDGTVAAWGTDNSFGELSVGSWTDIEMIAASLNCSYGLKTDGSVVATGRDLEGEVTEAQTWSNVKALYAGGKNVVALLTDDTVTIAGWDSQYTNFAEAEAWTTVGLMNTPTHLIEKDVKALKTSVSWEWLYYL